MSIFSNNDNILTGIIVTSNKYKDYDEDDEEVEEDEEVNESTD